MVDKTSRAMRRHHRARLLRRAQKIFTTQWYWFEDDPELVLRRARRVVNNMKDCSCWMCRNPRTSEMLSTQERLTMQERRENSRFRYEMQEVDIPDES